MWILRLSVVDPECIWSARTKKFGITDYQYQLAVYKTKTAIRVVSAHILSGDKRKQEAYIRAVKKDTRVRRIEGEGNFFLAVADEPFSRHMEAFGHPALVFIKPIMNAPNGEERWEIGSYEKKALTTFLDAQTKYYKGKLLSLKSEKVRELFISSISPRLTGKQKEALGLAITESYYGFPRGTTLEELARRAKISRPAFEERLRRGEARVMKFLKEFRI
ncbi:MAG: helix-turn-helix domain-containing protein [Candidatus Micrarchaeota archaeon]